MVVVGFDGVEVVEVPTSDEVDVTKEVGMLRVVVVTTIG